MSLLEHGQNRHYMGEIKENIGSIVPFFGAGVSIPYGYPSWADLVLKVLNSIRHNTDMTDDIYNKIQEHISKKHYMNATEEMSKCWPNLENYVCHEISEIQSNTSNSSCLGKYLHLFPSHLYLTTNYDDVVENFETGH
jgi:hypothetical protein